ncbi:MAG: 23S rRNA (adenine(2030)-N(6))-methyltransferase RlmJ [Steroidobacteraceae bacterium]
MRYHHNFHAGNFADVHKHVALLALLDALQAKAKGFLFLDTHAASGLADLDGADARRSEEAEQGWSRLTGAPLEAPELVAFRGAVQSLQQRCGARHYPGSPMLAAHRLRDQDRGIAFDTQAPTTRALERNLATAGLERRMRSQIGNGFAQLAAHWPPRERRSLALIDPPYESPDELLHALDAVAQGLERFETGVIAIWFPIKRERDLDRWLARVTATVSRPTLAALLWVHPLDSAAGLNGSGMLIVNPPYAMSQRLADWQDELRQRLAPEHGGSEVRWLVNER